MLESLFNSVAGRNFICERLLLFVSPQNIITNSSGEFGLDETSTECKVSIFLERTEAVARKCSVKNVFLEISQNSRENTCARISFLIKLQLKNLLWLLLNVTILFNQMQPKIKKSFFNILIIYKEDKKSFFNISINILIKFLTLFKF